MSERIIVTTLRVISMLGILISLIVACQYSYVGSLNEVILSGMIGILNLFVLYKVKSLSLN